MEIKTGYFVTLFSIPNCNILTSIFKMATNLSDFRSSCDIDCLPTQDLVIYCFGWFAIVFLGFVIAFILGVAVLNIFRKYVEIVEILSILLFIQCEKILLYLFYSLFT